MLAVLMVKMGGYMAILQYSNHKSDTFANGQISKSYYIPQELLEKIPTCTPYIQEQLQYENESGQIQLHANGYNYVQLRLTCDIIYVRCVPNYQKIELVNQNVICAKELRDTPLDKKNHVALVKKTGLDRQYNYALVCYNLAEPVIQLQATSNNSLTLTLHTHFLLPAQPPDPGILS